MFAVLGRAGRAREAPDGPLGKAIPRPPLPSIQSLATPSGFAGGQDFVCPKRLEIGDEGAGRARNWDLRAPGYYPAQHIERPFILPAVRMSIGHVALRPVSDGRIDLVDNPPLETVVERLGQMIIDDQDVRFNTLSRQANPPLEAVVERLGQMIIDDQDVRQLQHPLKASRLVFACGNHNNPWPLSSSAFLRQAL